MSVREIEPLFDPDAIGCIQDYVVWTVTDVLIVDDWGIL